MEIPQHLYPTPLHAAMKEWLPAGTVITHFQISSRISATGIGEVYQATDTSSGREVALKLLPASIIEDQQTRQQFIQTFSSIAQMRHQHFCRVYEAGITEDGRPFVAMEYVKGKSLDLISLNYGLSIPEIASIIIQIAEALEELHAQGWLHLAIKPANLMLTSDWQAKILDFGVGLVFQSQREGEGTDRRSDVLSLGAVFYEMLTGHSPFSGSSADNEAAGAPPPIMDFREEASPALNEIVMKALAKDPEARYRTMGDLARDLRSLFAAELARRPERLRRASDTSRSGKPDSAEGEKLPPGSLIDDVKNALSGLLESGAKGQAAARPKVILERERSFMADVAHFCRLYWRYLLVVFLFFAGLAIAVVMVATLADEGAEPEAPRAMQTTSLTTSGKVTSAAISPDGELLVYAIDEGDGQSLLLKELKGANETRIASARSIEYRGLTFSPDGRWICYLKSPAGAVFRVAARGGAEQSLPIANAISSVSFSPDGRSFAVIRTNDGGSETSLWVGDEAGKGAALGARSVPSAFQPTPPAWSPDGRVIVCSARDAESDLFIKLAAIEADGKDEHTLVSNRWSEVDRVVWRADGRGLIGAASEPGARRSQLWRVEYPSGDVTRITRDWSDYRDASLTRDGGILAAVQSEVLSNIWIAPATEANQARQVTTGRSDGVNGIAWTPDGRLVYVSLTNGRESVWVGGKNDHAARHRPLPTESGDGGQYQPAVSPDGRFITYVIERAGGAYLLRNEVERREFNTLAQERLALFPQFTPDGRWLIYSTIREGRGVIARIPSGGGSPQTLVDGRSWRAVLSPDGAKIACNYLDETTASWRLAVMPASGAAPTAVIGAPGSMHRVVQWTPDGARLAFIVTRGGVSNLWAQPISGEAPARLTDFKTGRIFNFAWSRDGQSLAIAQGWESSDVALIQNFR